MKKIIIFYVLILSYQSHSQLINQGEAKKIQCMTSAEMKTYRTEIFTKRDAVLREKNITKAQLRVAAPQQILFSWPLQSNADYDFTYNNSYISNFVDQNRNADPAGDDDVREPEWIDDWNCGKRTYDNHDAQDIATWPFAWHMYDVDAVMVVAAADGEILTKVNGKYDKNCAWGVSGGSNHITILHDDGSVSGYLHMKNGSLTSKPEGSRVKQGDFLGIVASSGNSTGPHLHFSVYDVNDNLIEPFTGTCNNLNPSTWWQNQRNYWEPQINKVMTHEPGFVVGNCWGNSHLGYDVEDMKGKNQFSSGEICIIGTYLQDAQNNDVITGDLYAPNGANFSSWTHTLNSTGAARYFTKTILLPAGNTGTWIVRMEYRNKNYYHFFTVGCNSSETVSGARTGSEGFIAGATITSTIPHATNSMSKVLYQAGTEITFSPGFEITAGAHLKARIKGCDFVE
jgi:murein DD-endopeptidase MepM/ murein hydrolase activator NlpD